jgi:hypothetical protein
MEKNGFSFSDFNHDEIEKILNNNSDDGKNDGKNYEKNYEKNDDEYIEKNDDDFIEKNKILENKEKLIDQKIEFYLKNQNNIENLNIYNLEDYDKIQNLINSNDFNFNLDMEELKKDMNIINEGIEVLKIDDIDFGENLNTFFNNFNNKENKIKVDNTENIVVIKAGKKKIK